MKKGLTSQQGRCGKCGRIIVKFTPAQPWMDKENYKDVCDDGDRHKLAPKEVLNG